MLLKIMGVEKRKSFVFNLEWMEVLEDYPREVRYEVLDAIIGYAQSGTLIEMKPLAKMAFSFIRKEMDYNEKKYEESRIRRVEAGKKGGRGNSKCKENETDKAMLSNESNALQEKQCLAEKAMLSNESYIVNVNVNGNVNDNVYKENVEKKDKLSFHAQNPDKDSLHTSSEIPPPLTWEQEAKAEKAKKYKYAEFVSLTRDEYAKLCAQYSDEGAKRMIEILDNYKGANGKRYKSDYRAILNWVVDRYNEEQQNGNKRKTNDRGYVAQNGAGRQETAGQTGPENDSGGNHKAQDDYSARF